MISPLSRTTHTLEMTQIDDLNAHLTSSPYASTITAALLGLEGAKLVRGHSGDGLPGTARLRRLCWDGPADYPYIHGHFSTNANGDAQLVVDMHTAHLKVLAHRLSLHQVWGVDA